MAEFLIITGMSGAGRSQAGGTLEDLGWFVIDNIPTALIGKVAELASAPGSVNGRIALIVGRAADQLDDLESAVTDLRNEGKVVVAYLEASDEVLIRRYEGTRRRHPLGLEGVTEAISAEREKLRLIRSMADVVIDTSDLNVHELRERMVSLFDTPSSSGMTIALLSFGFKWGVPTDVDNVWDVRFLPNPHWVPELRPQTGLDEDVSDYVLGQQEAVEFLAKLDEMYGFLLPAYADEGKSYLTVAIGCTGGRHRSVAITEALGAAMRDRGYRPLIRHRDLSR